MENKQIVSALIGIAIIGALAGLVLENMIEGDAAKFRQFAQKIKDNTLIMFETAQMATVQNMISHATVAFELSTAISDPDSIPNNGDEYILNQVSECVFVSPDDIPFPTCLICQLSDQECKGKVICPECKPPSIFTVAYEGPDVVKINLYEKEKKDGPNEREVILMPVVVDGEIVVNANDILDKKGEPSKKLPRNLFYEIITVDGTEVVRIHISCSEQPFFVGTEYPEGDVTLTIVSGTDAELNPTIPDASCNERPAPLLEGKKILPDGYVAGTLETIPLPTGPEHPENDVQDIVCVTLLVCGEKEEALFIKIDEDSIDNDDEPFTTEGCGQYLDETMFTSTPGCGEFNDSDPFSPLDDNTAYPVNDDLANPGVRNELRFFDANPGKIIELQVGHITDEGWHAPQIIPQSWIDAGPTDDGIRNYVGVMQMPGGPLVPGDGLGVGADPEALLDKIPDVRPIRYEGVLGLLGKDVCAVVYDSDNSINYLNPNPPGGVEDGNLQGATLGIVAFRVLQVIPFGDDSPFEQGQDPQEIAKVKIGILDAKNDQGTGVCQGNLMTYVAPFIVDEDDPFDSGYNENPTPAVALPFP